MANPETLFLVGVQTLGKVRAVPGDGPIVLRGVVSFKPEDDLGDSAIVYAETAHPGMTVSFDTPKVSDSTHLLRKGS